MQHASLRLFHIEYAHPSNVLMLLSVLCLHTMPTSNLPWPDCFLPSTFNFLVIVKMEAERGGGGGGSGYTRLAPFMMDCHTPWPVLVPVQISGQTVRDRICPLSRCMTPHTNHQHSLIKTFSAIHRTAHNTW